jgi:glucose-1-phosphate cytidylyltransferase
MKVVILAGGFGTRITEETKFKPKPMVEIGGKPILWHIMKGYSQFGISEFIICCGYKGNVIKEYFANYFLYSSDVTFDMRNNSMEVHHQSAEPWKVTLVDTGEATMTGGRLKRVYDYVKNEDAFCFTYGDGVSNVDINKLLAFHKQSNTLATLTAAYPPGRFGALNIKGDKVQTFQEKPKNEGAMVNAGFFVLSPKVLEYISGDDIAWELEPLEKLANESQLSAFKHDGFWQPMDTLRDQIYLQNLWDQGEAPWKTW